MTTQLSLPLAPKPARAPFVPRARQVDFPFVPGPECEPRGIETIPLWLRVPGEAGTCEMAEGAVTWLG